MHWFLFSLPQPNEALSSSSKRNWLKKTLLQDAFMIYTKIQPLKTSVYLSFLKITGKSRKMPKDKQRFQEQALSLCHQDYPKAEGHLQAAELHVIVPCLWQLGTCRDFHWEKKKKNHSLALDFSRSEALYPQLPQSLTTVGRKYFPTSWIMALATQNRFSI